MRAASTRRSGRESLDCALALKELVNMGVENIITFDAHDPTCAERDSAYGDLRQFSRFTSSVKYLLKT